MARNIDVGQLGIDLEELLLQVCHGDHRPAHPYSVKGDFSTRLTHYYRLIDAARAVSPAQQAACTRQARLERVVLVAMGVCYWRGRELSVTQRVQLLVRWSVHTLRLMGAPLPAQDVLQQFEAIFRRGTQPPRLHGPMHPIGQGVVDLCREIIRTTAGKQPLPPGCQEFGITVTPRAKIIELAPTIAERRAAFDPIAGMLEAHLQQMRPSINAAAITRATQDLTYVLLPIITGEEPQ